MGCSFWITNQWKHMGEGLHSFNLLGFNIYTCKTGKNKQFKNFRIQLMFIGFHLHISIFINKYR